MGLWGYDDILLSEICVNAPWIDQTSGSSKLADALVASGVILEKSGVSVASVQTKVVVIPHFLPPTKRKHALFFNVEYHAYMIIFVSFLIFL